MMERGVEDLVLTDVMAHRGSAGVDVLGAGLWTEKAGAFGVQMLEEFVD
jgi:hypothetical protein